MTSSTNLFFFFFNDTATTEIYTLSLHDALPIFDVRLGGHGDRLLGRLVGGVLVDQGPGADAGLGIVVVDVEDRKSTRLNSSHSQISYAVFCLKKKKHSSTATCRLSTRNATAL